MAGFWPLSLLQRVDRNGRPYIGAKAYFYEALTLTPLMTYADYGLGTPHPFPVEADGYGMFPAVFLDEADGFYRFRLTTAGGEVLIDLVQMPIIGPVDVDGGGAEEPVDPTRLWKTGDIKYRYGTGTHAGWVRANGRTIGSATSGATERANADCQALFEYLWAAASNTILPVSGGRGSSANADWLANKTITLPDWRGRTAFGVDDMGNSAASRLADSLVATGDATTIGASGGLDDVALTIDQMPAHTHPLSGTAQSAGAHTHNLTVKTESGYGSDSGQDSMFRLINPDRTVTTSSAGAHTHTLSGTATSIGGGGAHNNMPPFVLTSVYICL